MSGKNLHVEMLAKRASKSGEWVEFIPELTQSPIKSIWIDLEEATQLLGHINFEKNSQTRVVFEASPKAGKK